MIEIVETGIKAVDLYAPLRRGGLLAIGGEPGNGQLVLAFEIVRNLRARTGASVRFIVDGDVERFRQGLLESSVEADVAAGEGPTRAELRSGGDLLATVVIGQDPAAESWVTLTRDLLKAGQIPAIDAARSGTLLDIGDHGSIAAAAREAVEAGGVAGAGVLAFLRQWFTVAEPWTGQPGEYSALGQTLSGTSQFVTRRR